MRINFKWLEVKDLDPSKIDPSCSPITNVILQFGYDLRDYVTATLFKEEQQGLMWYNILGWSILAQKRFWEMLVTAYKIDKDAVKKWYMGGFLHLDPKKIPTDYILNGPTNSRDMWNKNRARFMGLNVITCKKCGVSKLVGINGVDIRGLKTSGGRVDIEGKNVPYMAIGNDELDKGVPIPETVECDCGALCQVEVMGGEIGQEG